MENERAYKKPEYLRRLEAEHDLHPEQSRKPLDVMGLRTELTILLDGDRERMQSILDLFARYLDTVSSDILSPEQPETTWDNETVRALLLGLARVMEAYRHAPFPENASS